MGKPSSSSTQLSRRSSTSKMNLPTISSQKSIRAKKKTNLKADEKIKSLFKELRNRTQNDISIIDLDDTPNQTPQKQCSLHHSTPIKKPSIDLITPIKQRSIDQINTVEPRLSIDHMILNLNKQLSNVEQNNNVTKEINQDSYLTIDLTTETCQSQQTVIDLDVNDDCFLTSISNASMSGDSDVTVLAANRSKRETSQIKKFKKGLVNLNESDKDKILNFISENLLNGCSVPAKIEPRKPATAEDTYIKEVIIGSKPSNNSIGSNVYNPERYVNTTGLRMVVVDGSNVAMAWQKVDEKCRKWGSVARLGRDLRPTVDCYRHSNHRYFSVQGLKIVIDYFLRRGHSVKAFVPKFRNKSGKSSDPQLLMTLERRGHVVFTPSREIHGRRITSYDDRYIIQCAAEFEGVIVSNDNFRDLLGENPRWKTVITSRVLPYNWVNGMIMFPTDPLGRNGPSLRQFLSMPKKNSQSRV